MTYSPHPSTIAYKVIEYMKQHPPGTWFSVRVLADAIDQRSDSIDPCMVTAVKHGLIRRERIDGVIKFALGDGDEPPEQDDEQPVRRIISESSSPAPADDAQPFVRPAAGPSGSRLPAQKEQAGRFEYGYSSRGLLTITKGRQSIALSQAEQREIARFINIIETHLHK